MITSQDIAELKRRFKKEECTITRMRGAYVDASKDIVTRIDRRLLNMDNDEFLKYLDIVKEPFQPKKIEDKVLTLEIEEEAESRGLLADLVNTELDDDEILEKLYELIIWNYSYPGNFLILVFYDTYDVITRTKDNQALDESEDVYRYITVCVCPVSLEKPAIQYDKLENSFKPLEREWIVGKPDSAFVYPAFDHRKEDRDEIMFYCADPSNPAHDIMECVLETKPQWTATEHRERFEDCVKTVIQGEEEAKDVINAINAKFEAVILDEQVNCEAEPARLDEEQMKRIVALAEITDDDATRIARMYANNYSDEYPKTAWLFSQKRATAHHAKKKHDRGRQIMRMLSTHAGQSGATDLMQMAEEYLDSTR